LSDLNSTGRPVTVVGDDGLEPGTGVGSVGHLVGQALHTFGLRSATLLCRVGLVVLIVKTLSPADYGAYSLISTFGVFGVIFCGLNLTAYVYRAVPGLPADRQLTVFKTTLVTEVVLSTVLILALLAAGGLHPLLRYLNAEGYEVPFAIGLVLVIVLAATAEIAHFFMAQARIEQANWVDFLSQAAWTLPLLGLVALHVRPSITMLLIAQMGGFVLVATYAARYLDVRGWWRARFDTGLLRVALLFSVPMIVPSVSQYSLRLSDRFLLAHYASVNDVGVYSLALTLLNTLYSFTAGVIFSAVGPRIFAAHNQGAYDRRDVLQTYMLKAGLVCFGMLAVMVSILAGPVIMMLARPDYAGAVRVIPIVSVSFGFLILGYPAHFLLSLQNRVVLTAVLDVIGMLIGIAANVLLIPRFSFIGAAVASVIGFAATTTLKFVWSGMGRTLRTDVLFSLREEMALLRLCARRLRAAFA
jgi:O-antigen/teichoic acid export membrane protein